MLRKTIQDFLGINKSAELYEPVNDVKLKRLLQVITSSDERKEIVYTKHNEPTLMVKSTRDFEGPETFKLITFTFGHLECFKIHFYIDKDKCEMEIIDVVVLEEEFQHKGYGTLLIQETIKHAKKNVVKRIYGTMMNDSKEHHQRQIAFYSKNGFTLYGNYHKFEMIMN